MNVHFGEEREIMNDYAGKTAVVTGAASGIGLALAERFVEERMQVVMADIQEDALDQAVAKMRERQGKVIGVVTDTMLQESIEHLAERAIDEFGNIHVLCNNAGVASTGGAGGKAIWEIPKTDWDWVMGVNFYGVLYGLQTFVPHMLAHGETGHIVNTASLAGLMPAGGTYGVSKHGVLVLTETLYNDLEARGANIGASVLCPGFVNTKIFDAERNRPQSMQIDNEAASEEAMAAGRALLAQGMAPEDLANAVFESIEEKRLYILPHPAWDDFVRSRVEHVLARQGPAQLNLEEMMRRRESGELF